MSDQTPRMPDLRWVPNIGVYTKIAGEWYPVAPITSLAVTLPADAVKLGDDKALRAEVQHWRSAYERLFAIGEERAGQFDEILAVLDSFDPNDWSTPTFAFEARRNFARIRAIVERETPREEPTLPRGWRVVPDYPERADREFNEAHEALNELNPVDEEPEEGSPSAIAAEELAALTQPKAATQRCTVMVGDRGEHHCALWAGHPGEHFAFGTLATETVVDHQPAQDSEDDALAAIGTRVMDDWAREIEKLTAERDQLRQYAETARHHQQQHAEAHRELANVRARIDTALAQISEWWPTGKNADRTLMAVNSILRGDVVRPASPVAKEGETDG